METIAVVDIETTGFSSSRDAILEVGIAELNLKTGKIEPLYDALVKEAHFTADHEKSWIFDNSDLDYEHILKAEPLDIEKIQEILNTYHATAYNKVFDFGFLKNRGLEVKELPCPMLLATNVCKIPSPKRPGSYKWPKVQESWDIFFGKEEEYIEKHRGLDDAIHEAKIVFYLFQQGVFKVPEICEDPEPKKG